MPIYDVICTKCARVEEIFRKIADFDNLPDCCGEKMERMLSAPNVQPDNTCYKSMKTGEMITSRTQHKNHLKQHGLIEVGNEQPKVKEFKRSEKEKIELRRDIAARLRSAANK